MARLGLGFVAAVAGATAVGPYVTYAVLRWMGLWVTVPLLMGYVPRRAEVGRLTVVCRSCAEPLSSRPAVPWLLRRGRCPGCGEPLARWWLLVELATALALGTAAWRFGWSLALVPVLVLCVGLVAVSVVDLFCWRIPTRFVRVTALAVLVAIVLVALAGGEARSIEGALVGALAYLAVLGALYLISRRQLGLGDVRLGWLTGLVVGWMSWTPELPVLQPMSGVLRALLIASVAGSVIGVVLLLARGRGQHYPFGPWLALGGFLSILAAAPGPL